MPTATAGPFLTDEARAILSEERSTLGRLRELLVAQRASEDDLRLLRQAELDLDELFLLVIVGEFNAGKSAVINALLGERVLSEGVTPTTAAITRLRFGPARLEQREGALIEMHYPLELLRDVAIVDTPGTNAILREHEEITSHFVPRADLVIFVTSADRPLTETERAFMEQIRTWGKKIVVVLNKADLLTNEQELADQLAFVRQNIERLVGFSPEIFPVSARLALAAREEVDAQRRASLHAASRFEMLESFILQTLDEASRIQLKLATPLGVADRVSRAYIMAAEEKRALLAEDIALVGSVERQLELYRDDTRRDFGYRLEEIENVLHEMTARGTEYLDETLRLGNVLQLIRPKQVKAEFERVVVGDTPDRIDRATQELIDWMVDQDLKLWRTVTDQLERRGRAGTPGSPAERLAGSFDYDRRALLGSLGRTAREVIQRHDHRREATQLAQSVRDAVAQTTLLEAGAVGLGAVSVAIVGSVAADATGLVASGVLAGLGLWILPRKRRQAKERFLAHSEELRSRLLSAMREEFDRELQRSMQRIKDALAPYDRFVRTEHESATRLLHHLQAVLDELRTLRARLDAAQPSVV